MPGPSNLAALTRLALYGVRLGWAVLTVLGAIGISAVAAIESAMGDAVSRIVRSLPIASHRESGEK